MVIGLIEDGVDAVGSAADMAVEENVDAAQTILDVPADAGNTLTGACKGGHCGLFGDVDRALDPRGSSKEDFATGSDHSGIWAGLRAGRNSTTAATDEVGKTTTDPIFAALGFTSMTEEGKRQKEQEKEQKREDTLDYYRKVKKVTGAGDNGNQQQTGGMGLSTGLLALVAIGGATLFMGGGS